MSSFITPSVPSLSFPSATADKNLEHFVRALASKFYCNASDMLQFTNDYWGTQYKELKLEDLIYQSSRSSSVASTPRLGPTDPSTAGVGIETKLQTLAIGVKRTSRGGPNKCIYKFKSGARKDQMCGVSCTGDFCATHGKSITPSAGVARNQPDSLQAADAFSLAADEIPQKRKMQKRAPITTPIQQFMQAKAETQPFKVVRKPNGVLVDPEHGLVYDETKDAIYGFTTDDGKTIQALSKDKIELCKQLQLHIYELPPNLATTTMVRELEVEDPVDAAADAEEDDDMYEDIAE